MAPYLLGGSTAGLLEASLFHPIDTIGKRLMYNTETVSRTNIKEILFRDAASHGFFRKYRSLLSGLRFSAVYKVMQRAYRFGGQPLVRNALERRFGHSKTDLVSACAGALIGAGEVLILPIDQLKIKAQTNPGILRGRGVFDVLWKEGFKLYRGWNWAFARNVPGSFAFFGTNSLVYSKIWRKPVKDCSIFEVFLASACSGVCSIVVCAPLDIIKTRVQSRPFDDPRSGMSLVQELLKHEGPSSFYKGICPKLVMVSPKLVFSFTVAQFLILHFENLWEKGHVQQQASSS